MSGARANKPSATLDVRARRRVLLLMAALLLLVGAVGARTVYLQSVKNRMLTKYAKGQQQNTQQLPAVRGDIVDRNGQELAIGEEAVTFYAVPKLLKNRSGTALEIAKILDLSSVEEGQLVDRLTNATGGFVYVARQVPRDQAQKLQDAKIDGIQWYDEERRMYPVGATAGQLVGTVDIDNKGLTGIELLYDKWLTGTPGMQVAVNDPNGVPIDVLKLKRERDGKDVQLTLDANIQQETERILKETKRDFAAEAATAIVMDPRTGEILAMANAPGVNPAKWSAAPASATRNRAITDTYEPGSTFKVVTVSAALEEGLVQPNTELFLPSKLTFCDEEKTCTVGESHPRPEGWFSVRDILVQSSNIGTIKLAQKIRDAHLHKGEGGNAAVDAWIRRFGFGKPTGIDFPGESGGIMSSVDDWTDVSIGNIPIGQGIAVTPIQLISAYAAIANGGVMEQPHLLQRVGDEPQAKTTSRRVISAKTAATMRRMFEGVVTDEHGTGHKAEIKGYAVAGKTGTANVAGSHGYIKGQYMASFVGFVPARNPRLVTLVVVTKPQRGAYGGDVAAPAFERITKFALEYLNIAPDGR